MQLCSGKKSHLISGITNSIRHLELQLLYKVLATSHLFRLYLRKLLSLLLSEYGTGIEVTSI